MPKRVPRKQYLRYPSYLSDPIPAGLVVVHNQVRPPERQLGTRGFRAWLSPPNPAGHEIEVCNCGWAPELGRHFRVKGAWLNP
jgi:hypothetical protein